jgi:hypothetical protein
MTYNTAVSAVGGNYNFTFTEGSVFDPNNVNHKLGYGIGTYTLTNVPSGHPIAILNSGYESFISYSGDIDKKSTMVVGGVSYDFYYGNVTITVNGVGAQPPALSYYCRFHGYMGGNNRLIFSTNCNLTPTSTPTLTPTPTPTATVTSTPTPTTTPSAYSNYGTYLNISSGNYVSGGGVTVYGATGTKLYFNELSPINNPLNFTEIRLYVSNTYTYRMTVFTEIIAANLPFVLISNTGIVYQSSFGSGYDVGADKRIDLS